MISVLLTSSILILVILLLRGLLRGKVGNVYIYALWLVVALRLLMPVPEFILEKVAGIEKPWVSSSVSVMNVAVRLVSDYGDKVDNRKPETPETKEDSHMYEKVRGGGNLQIFSWLSDAHSSRRLGMWQFTFAMCTGVF